MMTATKTILCADDSLTALTMHQMILKSHGYRVVTAQDGFEAVTKAGLERPDLILMDVVMPRMTGFEAVKQLRNDAATRAIPVIMVTTRAEPKVIETCFQAGCNDYVNKPVDGAILLSKVRALVGV
jgi:twitching motility two-component system response regulator PilH